MQKSWADRLWGDQARVSYLLIATFILLLTMLGSKELWTQEHRWADIVAGMFYRHDFLHPYLGDVTYYDKPLLFYWLIAALSYLNGQLTIWTLRMPSAFAGILAVWSIYKIGSVIATKRLGLLSGWMLATTFYFVFWAKVSSADMLNLGGSLFAVAWYYSHRDDTKFGNYCIFFLILALTALCKGLIGLIVPLIVILPDLLTKQRFLLHLNSRFFLAIIPALIVYLLPFMASAHFNTSGYNENGLYLVYRENVLRYFQPFDHEGPIYTYFIFLPIYLLPWTVFFIPALASLKTRWPSVSSDLKNICWAALLLFVFLTISGSRRNYYVLPLVPFTLLITADWLMATVRSYDWQNRWAGRVAVSFFIVLFLNFNVIQPLYNAQGGVTEFAKRVQKLAEQQQPWASWQFVLLDPESKIRFYLQVPPTLKNTEYDDIKAIHPQPHTIYFTRKSYVNMVQPWLANYRLVTAIPSLGERLLNVDNPNAPVAFIPRA